MALRAEIKKGEEIAFNILKNTAQNAQVEAQRTTAARNAFIELLEIKYKARHNLKTGMLEKRETKKERVKRERKERRVSRKEKKQEEERKGKEEKEKGKKK